MASKESFTGKQKSYLDSMRKKHRSPSEIFVEDLGKFSNAPATMADYTYIRNELNHYFAGRPSKVVALESHNRLVFTIPWRNTYILLNYMYGEKQIRVEKFGELHVDETEMQTSFRFKGNTTVVLKKRIE